MIETRRFRFGHRGKAWEGLDVNLVPTHVERIVPPAGERYAFDVRHYKRTVQVLVSPTGRSVRVFVDGKEIK